MKTYAKRVVGIIVGLVALMSVNAQNTFQKQYHVATNKHHQLRDLISTSDNEYLQIGHYADAYNSSGNALGGVAIKVDQNGAQQWTSIISEFEPQQVIEVDRHYIVSEYGDGRLIALDNAGFTTWMKDYEDYFYETICPSHDDNILMAGRRTGASENWIDVAKVALNNGNIIWAKRIILSGGYLGAHVALLKKISTGYFMVVETIANDTEGSLVIWLDFGFNIAHCKMLADTDSNKEPNFKDAAQAVDGSMTLIGDIVHTHEGSQIVHTYGTLITNITPTNVNFSHAYSFTGWDIRPEDRSYSGEIIENDSGKFIAGYFDIETPHEGFNNAFYLLKLNQAGDVQWCKQYQHFLSQYVDNVHLAESPEDIGYMIGGSQLISSGFIYSEMTLIATHTNGYSCLFANITPNRTPYPQSLTNHGHETEMISINVEDALDPPSLVTANMSDRCYMYYVEQPRNSEVSQVEEMEPELVLFPNPATEYVGIQFVQGNYNIEVIDLRGKRVLHQQGSGPETLNLSNLSPGLYTVRASNSVYQNTQRLLVE